MRFPAARHAVRTVRAARGGSSTPVRRAATPFYGLPVRRAAGLLWGASLLMAGCARMNPPRAEELLGRNHKAEESLCYISREVNQQVVTSQWPVRNGRDRVQMYGRPVTTTVIRTDCGPQQRRFEVVSSDAPGMSTAGLVVVQNGFQGWRFVPAARRIDLLTFPNTSLDQMEWLYLVLNNYDVENIHADRVAGVRAWYLELRPKHEGRPMKRLWLDAETSLPLRQELWGPAGHLISATQVLERPTILENPDPAAFGPPLREGEGGVRVVKGDQDWRMPDDMVYAALGYPLGQLNAIPDGFKRVGTYLHICTDTLGPCARWELSDGVATVNVIQTKMAMDDVHGIDTPQDVQGPIATVQRGPYHFIVRGNLPNRELRRIADNITLGQPRH